MGHLAADILIPTYRAGMVPARNVIVGDNVMVNGRRWPKVKRIIRSTQPIFFVLRSPQLARGFVTFSGDTRVLTGDRKMVCVSDLKCGDVLEVNYPSFLPNGHVFVSNHVKTPIHVVDRIVGMSEAYRFVFDIDSDEKPPVSTLCAEGVMCDCLTVNKVDPE